MFKVSENIPENSANRKLVLAENYRLLPAHENFFRGSVYDGPKCVTRKANAATKNVDRAEIRDFIHAALQEMQT